MEAYGEPDVPERWRETVLEVRAPAPRRATSTPRRWPTRCDEVPRSRPFDALDELASIAAPTVDRRQPRRGRPRAPLRRRRGLRRGDPRRAARVRGAGPLAAGLAGRPALEGHRGRRGVGGAGVSKSAGYSGTPLPRKLGIKEGSRVAVLSAPGGFDATLGALPDGVAVRTRARGPLDVIVFFTTSRAALGAADLDAARRARSRGTAVGRVAEARVGSGDGHDGGRGARDRAGAPVWWTTRSRRSMRRGRGCSW